MIMSKEEIKEKLKAIQNRFNKVEFDDEDIEFRTTFIYQDKDGNPRNEKDQHTFLLMTYTDCYRELIKEYKHVVLVKNKSKKYFILIKREESLYKVMELFSGIKDERLPMIYEMAEDLNKIYSEKYVRGKIEFPSGDIIFSNFFYNKECNNYAFDVPKDLKYKERNSINHSLGEQNTMKILSETHGLGYVQLGNTSAVIYKVSDDKIIITSSYLDYYDEKIGEDVTLTPPDSWEYLGTVSCDVWRVEFIDRENFLKGDTLPMYHEKYQYNKPFTAKVNPGTWTITNRYHFIHDNEEMKKGRIPMWVEIERI